ncbi:MAG: class I SAM-dependent methyltransferase [Cyanobacteria bacterium P01_F01_bin.150]
MGDVLGSANAWQEQVSATTARYNQEFEGKPFDLPPDIESMPIFREWASGALANQIASPFWELMKPKKKERCLDLGCGLSFLVYPCWREWDAQFYGQDVSPFIRDTLTARGPQLNSKLFKGVKLAPAHLIDYDGVQFDWAIATGFSCYYSLNYWVMVLEAVKQVQKSGGTFIFDVLNPDIEMAENWAILEMYLGAEVFLHSLDDWRSLIKEVGGKITKEQDGSLFHLYRIKFS